MASPWLPGSAVREALPIALGHDHGIVATAVDTEPELGHRIADVGEDQDLVAGAAFQHVDPGPTVELVVAAAALEMVVARAAGQNIVVEAAIEPVVATAALEQIIARAAQQHVVAGAALQMVVTAAPSRWSSPPRR